MTDDDKTYRLSKLLNLFSEDKGCRWQIDILDRKFPTIICAQNHTSTRGLVIKLYDIKNIPELIIEFNLPKNIYFHKGNNSISSGLHYNEEILTFVEKMYPDSTDQTNDDLHKVTRYLLSSEEKETIKKISTYVINGAGGQIYNNRLFCSSRFDGINIYDVSDGRLIESFCGQIVSGIKTKKLVALESKTQIILYCTLTDRKNVIDKQINNILYCGKIIYPASQDAREYRENSQVDLFGDDHIIITMYDEDKTHTATILYKLIEDTNVDEKDQCCVCFHFTDKNKALIPCGHTQFCDKCIGILKKCPLCDKDISSILTIYK